jgi:hypothetical protein
MPDLEKAVRYFDSDPNINVSKEIGSHQNKQNWKKQYVITINEKKSTAVDIETNLLLLQACLRHNNLS